MTRRRRSPLVVASALSQALTKAVARTSLDLAEEAAAGVGRALARGTGAGDEGSRTVGQRLLDGDLGVGPLRLRPQDVAWLRRQVAAGLRTLLLIPEDTAERLRTADPTTMARTLLALVGGEEALVPLPSPEQQIRQRFRDLLDPETTDGGTLASALLTITAQLSPDEARILRHVARTDRAVVVSVEAGSLTSRRGPTLAEHLSVLVERAGGDHPERGPAYITNLVRLGLCAVDEQATGDHPDIALIEETAGYRAAIGRAREQGGRPRVHDATLVLTDLGRELVAIAVEPDRGTVDDGPPPAPPGDGVDRSSLASRVTVTRPIRP